MALKQGDDTAYMLGRVSMNPMAHLDWIGTIIFPAMAIGSGMPLLGWAKPVPVNPRKYRNYVRGDILVSIAGVVMNAILAVAFAVLLCGDRRPGGPACPASGVRADLLPRCALTGWWGTSA